MPAIRSSRIRLRLDNVRSEGSHVFIDGKLGKYSVHLDSGVARQIGGTI